MANYLGITDYLKEMGFYDFALPWLLAFAIVYGILGTTEIFKIKDKPNKPVNAIISIVFAFFVTSYTPYGIGLSKFFAGLFGQGALVLSTLLVLILFLGLIGLYPGEGKKNIFSNHPMTWGLIFIGIVVILLVNTGIFTVTTPSIKGDVTGLLSMLFFVGILAVAIYFVVKEK